MVKSSPSFCTGQVVNFDDLKHRARDGEPQAVEALIQLVESSRRQYPQASVYHAWPSIRALTTRLSDEKRPLAGEDRDLVSQLCLEIAANADLLPFLDVAVSRIPQVMDRVVLYEDAKIIVRAHLFLGDASETIIHNHGRAMISTCLEGSYVHKIYQINTVQGQHYRFVRKTGGFYEKVCEPEAGEIENILCQPFEAGQSMYFSALAKHTVAGLGPGARVSTLTVHDAKKRFSESEVFSATPEIDGPSEACEIIDDVDQLSIKTRLQAAVRAFRGKVVQSPATAVYLDNISHQVEIALEDVRRTQEMVAKLLNDRQDDTATRERERENLRCGLIFCGHYFEFLLSQHNDIALTSGEFLHSKLRLECLRLGIPGATVETFLDSQGEQLDLLIPYLPRQLETCLRFLRYEMGGGQKLIEAEAATLRSQLESLGYPRVAGIPIQQRRSACLSWIVGFANNVM